MAAYLSNFVLSVIGPDGKPYREKNENDQRVVRIPFETEYKLRLKNQKHVRCKAKVYIDGMDISPDSFFILKAGETLDLERFLDGNNQKGPRFKFISRERGMVTGELQDPTSDKLGHVQVEFFAEKTWLDILSEGSTTLLNKPYQPVYGGSFINSTYQVSGHLNGVTGRSTTGGVIEGQSITTNCIGIPMDSAVGKAQGISVNLSDVGGTAEGSVSHQTFQQTTDDFQTHPAQTISIQLKAPTYQVRTETPVQHKVASVRLTSQGIFCEFNYGVPPEYCMLVGNELVIKVPISSLEIKN